MTTTTALEALWTIERTAEYLGALSAPSTNGGTAERDPAAPKLVATCGTTPPTSGNG